MSAPTALFLFLRPGIWARLLLVLVELPTMLAAVDGPPLPRLDRPEEHEESCCVAVAREVAAAADVAGLGGTRKEADGCAARASTSAPSTLVALGVMFNRR